MDSGSSSETKRIRRPRFSRLADRPMSIGNSCRQGPHQLAQKLSNVNLASEERMVCKIPGPSKRTTPDSSAATSGPGDGERGDEVSGDGAVEAVLGSELEG